MRGNLFLVYHSFVFIDILLHSQMISDCWGGEAVINKRIFVCENVLVIIYVGGIKNLCLYTVVYFGLYDFAVRW